MLTAHNQKLYTAGKKRRAMLLKLNVSGISCSDLARKFKVSRARMSKLLIQAREEVLQEIFKGARGLT